MAKSKKHGFMVKGTSESEGKRSRAAKKGSKHRGRKRGAKK
jgi:hypothetical protein